MDNTDLVKTVRGLDQNGPGDHGETLQSLWNLLVATPHNSFHAAEESSLRWLLKSMTGSPEAAEKLRRYPLTWTILDCVFQRIPLFSLAKSLADRKFLLVLQQTLKDVAKPVESPDSLPPSKRKRSTTTSFSMDLLRSQEGCLDTAKALFFAVKRLLDRLDSTVERCSRDKLGAEHIKSLFCTSAADATAIATPALKICQTLLSSDRREQIGDCENWVQVITTVWDLHLQGPDDVSKVAEHIFEPAAFVLAKLGAFKSPENMHVGDSFKNNWLPGLQHFMYRNFVLPGRAAFVNKGELEAHNTALSSCRNTAHLAVPALYFLASYGYKVMAKGGLRKDNDEWIKQIFQIAEQAIRDRPDRNSLMQSILEEAIEKSSPISVLDLRRVCREYALQKKSTDWPLVAKIAQCETDVFQLSDDGAQLRKEVCERIAKQDNNEDDKESIAEIIEAMKDGFRTRRDLPGFLQLWFEQLCEAETRKLQDRSPWFKAFQSGGLGKNSFHNTLETEMSPQRLNEMIAWVKDNSSASNTQATSVFASTLAQSVRSEQCVDAIGRQLFDLVAGFKGSSPFSALRWRVVSTVVSWVHPSERGDIWSAVKKRLTRTAEKSTLLSAESYEAFKCCCKFWDILSPDDAHAEEPAALIEVWMQRLSADMASARVLEGGKMTSAIGLGVDAEFDEYVGYQQYLAWTLNGSSRFAKLYFTRAKVLPPVLTGALLSRKSSTAGVATLWTALLCNEVNLSDANLARSLTDRLITALDESQKERDWPGENGRMWMKILSSMPLDSLDRSQREKIMAMLAKRQSSMTSSPADVDLAGWKLILGLTAKIMKRPTFYEGLRFAHLVECSEALSSASVPPQDNNELVVELIERFSLMATAVVKQMADHVDERSIKYFQEASTFVANCEKQSIDAKPDHSGLPAFYMTLLRCLATELSQSTSVRSNKDLVSLLMQTQQVVSKCVVNVITSCITGKKWLDSHDLRLDMIILAATDAASAVSERFGLTELKSSFIRKLEKHTREAMQSGDIRAWKIHIFLRKYFSNAVEVPRPSSFDDLKKVPHGLREALLRELVESATENMDAASKLGYLRRLVHGFKNGCDTDGQLLAIEHVAGQLISSTDFLLSTAEGFSLGTVHSELTSLLLKRPSYPHIICRILRTLLGRRPQCMGQWNIEITLSTMSDLACLDDDGETVPSYSWLCKLVEVIIKKHRIRLEGHFHLLLSTMQILLRSLVTRQSSPSSGPPKEAATQEAHAHLYAKLVALICEPTAGAVSRSQLHGSLDSAADAAKRSAGRHMYLLLVQYVKLQLESNVSTQVREALEPAMYSIFDITPPEGRKILNDAMDASGRAILKEMFKRYVKFGKWSGI